MNGQFVDGTWNDSKFLIIGVFILIINVLLMGYFTWLFIKFNKNKVDRNLKYKNSVLISILYTMMSLAIIISIVIFVFFTNGENILSSVSQIDKTASSLFLTLSIIGALISIAVIVLMWMAIYVTLVIFEEDKISFTGEFIAYKRIVKIINDDNKLKLYIIYRQGRRGIKKLSFSREKLLGAFMVANISKTGIEIEQGDGQATYLELVKTTQASFAEKIKEVKPKKQKTKEENNK